jgi:hypothetical protein
MAVGLSAAWTDRGVEVAVEVKVGSGVGVSVGIEVETRATGLPLNKSVRRQACRKANKPAKPALLKKFLRFIDNPE